MTEGMATSDLAIPGMGGPGMGRGGMGSPGRGGNRFPQEHADGRKVLERISKETGGRMFEVSRKEPVDQIYAQIEQELRDQYSLGYTPDRGSSAESGYHKIQVAAKAERSDRASERGILREQIAWLRRRLAG
jgi:hypothetical protein